MSTVHKILQWRLVATLDDGREAQCPVNLDFDEDVMKLMESSRNELIQHRLWESYMSLEHFVNPKGPPLPKEVKKALKGL